MTPQTLPYVAVPGAIHRIFQKIKEAETPTTFNADFLGTKLGFNGGNYRTFISWAKKAGMLNPDGTPTQLYKQFRNPSTSGPTIAKLLKNAYAEVYSRNEYCYELDKTKFKGLIVEITGDPHNSKKVENIVNTFFNVKELADFDANLSDEVPLPLKKEATADDKIENQKSEIALGLNYTINLTLPKTDDPAVYAAIFKSLKENLLNN